MKTGPLRKAWEKVNYLTEAEGNEAQDLMPRRVEPQVLTASPSGQVQIQAATTSRTGSSTDRAPSPVEAAVMAKAQAETKPVAKPPPPSAQPAKATAPTTAGPKFPVKTPPPKGPPTTTTTPGAKANFKAYPPYFINEEGVRTKAPPEIVQWEMQMGQDLPPGTVMERVAAFSAQPPKSQGVPVKAPPAGPLPQAPVLPPPKVRSGHMVVNQDAMMTSFHLTCQQKKDARLSACSVENSGAASLVDPQAAAHPSQYHGPHEQPAQREGPAAAAARAPSPAPTSSEVMSCGNTTMQGWGVAPTGHQSTVRSTSPVDEGRMVTSAVSAALQGSQSEERLSVVQQAVRGSCERQSNDNDSGSTLGKFLGLSARRTRTRNRDSSWTRSCSSGTTWTAAV